MLNEANAIMGHHEAADRLADFCRRAGGPTWREFALPDKRRADVFWASPNGGWNIFEVKGAYSETFARSAVAKYGRWCNSIWIAVPELDPAASPRLRFTDLMWESPSQPGIVSVFRNRIELIRVPRHTTMHADNTRKIKELLLRR